MQKLKELVCFDTGIILCFQYFRNGIKNKNNYINVIIFLILLLILLFWFKNPLTEKRNALGPIYITLIFLFIPKLLNSNIKTLSFLFFSMIIIFPLTAILTHSDATFLEMYRNPSILIDQMKGGGIVNAFTSLNYDAFANNAATIELVHTQGFSYGYQLLGGVFFFIPRSIWTIKPFSSGEMIGEYLVNNYGYGFTNLSNSFVSEGFLNFGILGVVLFAIILAFVIIKLISWLNCDNLLKKMMAFYFSIHLIFFLRGDFTNGFSYYIGPLLAVVLIPKLIEIFTNLIDNACKYSDSDTVIKISLVKKMDTILFSIKDQGVGIPKKYLSGLKGSKRSARANLIKAMASAYKLGARIPKSMFKARVR